MEQPPIGKCILALVVATIGCALPLTIPVSYAEGTQTYSDTEYHFSFKFPASWRLLERTTPNTKAKIASSPSTLAAECAVTVKAVPQLNGRSQDELDQLLLQSPPDKQQYQVSLMQGFGDVSVIAVSQGRLGSRIAHMVRSRYSIGNESTKEFVSVRMAKAFSPGTSWVLTCGGKGKTPAEAEKAFEYWQAAINNVFATFRSP
jgi:hypothetical protein